MKAESPKFGTDDWHAQRAAELDRIAARNRPRSSSRDSRALRSMRAEMSRLSADVATFGRDAQTNDGTSIDQRIFELQQQIRAEEERLQSVKVPPYAAHAATAASARVPGEDDE